MYVIFKIDYIQSLVSTYLFLKKDVTINWEGAYFSSSYNESHHYREIDERKYNEYDEDVGTHGELSSPSKLSELFRNLEYLMNNYLM